MVPPDRSTPRRKPPPPFWYCDQAQPTTRAARTTGSRQRTIRLVYDFMGCSGRAFLRRLGRLLVGQVAGDTAFEHPQADVVRHPHGDLVLVLADGDDGAVDAARGEHLVVLLHPLELGLALLVLPPHRPQEEEIEEERQAQ